MNKKAAGFSGGFLLVRHNEFYIFYLKNQNKYIIFASNKMSK
jgi:hypothetical protein